MISKHEAYPERIVFLNRDIFWGDVSYVAGNPTDTSTTGLLFPKDTMLFIFTGEIIRRMSALDKEFIYTLTSLSPKAGQWLMDLNWLEITPSSINTKVSHDIHMIMEHVNKLQDRVDHNIDWKQKYKESLIDRYEHAIIVNEFYDGYDEFEWNSREVIIRDELESIGLTPSELVDLRRQFISETLMTFNEEYIEEYVSENQHLHLDSDGNIARKPVDELDILTDTDSTYNGVLEDDIY